MTQHLIKINTEHAPPALGPYSQGILVNGSGRLLFVSGQLPIDPKTNKLIDGDIRTKTKRVIDNISAILASGGSSLHQVVRVEVFLTHLTNDFSEMNLEYLLHFNHAIPPVRQTVGVSELPLGSSIEISCIAMVQS